MESEDLEDKTLRLKHSHEGAKARKKIRDIWPRRHQDSKLKNLVPSRLCGNK